MWVATHNSHMPRVSEATKSQHRERLLAAAAAEFAERGLGGARVDDISLAAGLAKGTIYNYFDSKEHIFREVIAAWWDRIEATREPLPDDASTAEQLGAVLRADIAVMADMEEFARTAFREVLFSSRDQASSLLPSWDPLDAELLRLMDQGRERGELRRDLSAEDHVRMFAALVNGLLIELWLPNSTLDLAELPAMAVDFFLSGAAERPS